tara:strand:- start:1224 stop:1424 length:201 start_codon:yes stop_codon:yes gene_type:complete
MKIKESLKKFFVKVNKAAAEDMSEYDPKAEYDTRVKLPEWQLKKLKNRRIKKNRKPLVRIEDHYVP